MIPNPDEHPARNAPFVTWGLILICVGAFVWELQQGPGMGDAFNAYGFIPSSLMSPQIETPGGIPAALSILTSLFLHGSSWHLAGNLLYLWIFGTNLEEGMGHLRFLLLYLLSGIVAALTMAFMDPLSAHPMVGASGAISGVLGAYMLLYPRRAVVLPIPALLIVYQLRIAPIVMLGLWFAMQLLALTGPDTSEIAWWAHLGGFGAGIALTPFLKTSDVPYFGPRPPRGP